MMTPLLSDRGAGVASSCNLGGGGDDGNTRQHRKPRTKVRTRYILTDGDVRMNAFVSKN